MSGMGSTATAVAVPNLVAMANEHFSQVVAESDDPDTVYRLPAVVPEWMEWFDDDQEHQFTAEFPRLNIQPDISAQTEFMDMVWPSAVDGEGFPFSSYYSGSQGVRLLVDSELDSIWSSAHVQQVLSQPVGTPFELSMDEARAILKASFDTVHDLPDREEFAIDFAETLGHSIMEDVKRSDG